jgi:phospholipase A-2-activating protein
MEVRLNKDGPALQLGFNLGEQPELAAQRFLEKNKLPVKFLSHLSALVSDQMSELQFGAGSSYVDPFTGGGRYVPGGGSSTSNGGR